MKKLLLILFLPVHAVGYHGDYARRDTFQDAFRTTTIVTACAVGAVAAYYLATREPNGSIIAHVNHMYSDFKRSIHAAQICHIHELRSSEIFRDCKFEQIFMREQQLINRYGSYIKPWNWSYEMYHAYMMIRPLAILKRSTCLVEMAHNPSLMAEYARRQARVGELYPCHVGICSLYDQISYLSNNSCVLSADSVGKLALELLPFLREGVGSLQSSKEYFEELAEMRRIALQQKQLELQKQQLQQLQKLNKKL